MQLDAALGRALESQVEALEHLDDGTELRWAYGFGDGDGERRDAVAEVTETERAHRRESAHSPLGLQQPGERMDRRDHDLDLMKSPLVGDSELRERDGRGRPRLRLGDKRLLPRLRFGLNDRGRFRRELNRRLRGELLGGRRFRDVELARFRDEL